MNFWQNTFVLIFGIINLLLFIKAFWECYRNNNSFGDTKFLYPLGSFVWADHVVFGIFWTLVATVSLILNDWILFLLCVSLFWLVRSFGETIYWFLQQFSTINRNPTEKYFIHKIFHNDSVWFVHQIFHQCVTITTIITSLYLAKHWLEKF